MPCGTKSTKTTATKTTEKAKPKKEGAKKK